ncbi:MAG: hypothetical protein R3312_09735, partial [Gammaproteobacteria bacterium]|nr:hypothetical protein [Gammaproteobacteria bacterium]
MLVRLVLLMFIALSVSTGFASQASIDELRAQCEEARDAHLAPLREGKIQECIAHKEKSPDECKRFYSDYGDGGRTAAGGHRERMFHDIP